MVGKQVNVVIKGDYYAILNVARTATAEQIRSAHRAQSRRYHPDTADDGRGDPSRFALIQEAYEILSVPDFRRRYDTKQAAARGETKPRGTQRPPKSPCGACKKPVFASQLILYLGRYICQTCFKRKQQREAKRPRLTGMAELRWQLKRLAVWAQSHVAAILIVLTALGAAGARLAWVNYHARHPEHPAQPGAAPSTVKDSAAPGAESSLPSSERADVSASETVGK